MSDATRMPVHIDDFIVFPQFVGVFCPETDHLRDVFWTERFGFCFSAEVFENGAAVRERFLHSFPPFDKRHDLLISIRQSHGFFLIKFSTGGTWRTASAQHWSN
jgi:hypothetical protein